MAPMRLLILHAFLFTAAVSVTVSATELQYEKDVRPLLKEHCFHCHGERGVTEAGLDLRLRRFILKGGESGQAIVPGDAENSLLLQRVAAGEMPPDQDKQLAPEAVAILRRWIQAGAPTEKAEPESLDAGNYFTQEERNWWSFRPVARPLLPSTSFAIDEGIDAFVLNQLNASTPDAPSEATPVGLSPRADQPTLVRRIFLDMLGIPPTPEAIQRFLADPRPDAWQRLIDRVLASPRYGERWGRHWLDVAGYADSEGYNDEDRVREHAWRYRDYVIRAFNADKPYSQFLLEQLAGDELAGWPHTDLSPETIETLAATGFLRMAPDGTASSGIDQNVARNQVIADTLQIVSGAVLGLTVQCAQCHDHRYDPIPQRDYYQLRAIFEPALNWKQWQTPSQRLVSLYSDQDKQQRTDIESQAKLVDARRKERVTFFIDKTLEHELLMVDTSLQQPLRTAFKTPAAKRTPEQKQLLESHVNVANITEGSLYLYERRREARAKDLEQRRADQLAAWLADANQNGPGILDEKSLAQTDPKGAEELARYTTAVAEIRSFRIQDELKKLASEAQAIRDTIPQEHFLRVLSEAPGAIPATFVFHRGDHQQPREEVRPQGLSVLQAQAIPDNPQLKSSGRRMQFARYLTSGQHPLVARVLANRIWAHHFGRGIVATTGDFGFLGDRPTHPQLLDWLATELVDSQWSSKHLHRRILSSGVYQQTAVGSADLVLRDPENQLWGRWPLRRLESETVRDAILTLTGELSTKMYGEPVPVMEDAVGQIVLGKENLDGERKPTKPIPLGEEAFRRSVYIQVRRSRPLSVLASFDLPELAPHCTDRASSNVAPQSLMLMNSDFILNTSAALAERLLHDQPDQPLEQLRRGWELVFGQPPDQVQLTRAHRFLQQQTENFTNNPPPGSDAHRAALATYCQALFGTNRFLYIE